MQVCSSQQQKWQYQHAESNIYNLQLLLKCPEHQNLDGYPTGKKSCCSYNRDITLGTKLHKPIKNLALVAVVKEIQPLLDLLGSKEFLVSCEDDKMQNVDES